MIYIKAIYLTESSLHIFLKKRVHPFFKVVKLDELSLGVPSFLKSDPGKLLRIAIL